jgi:membrane-associated protease RseP (regulator of RpoE activity)
VTGTLSPETATQPSPDPEPRSSTLGALVRLAVVVVAAVAIATFAGAESLLIVIVAIIAMVMIHELGHFATAKWSKMLVTQYFVGFGPTLWSVRRGETEYGIKAIPAGGFVKIPGMTNLDEVDPADEPRTYRQQPFYKRIIVASAGSFMHLVMALVLAWIAIVTFGVAAPQVRVGGFVQWQGQTQNAAQAGGLRAGDEIVSVNGRALSDPNQLTATIKRSAGETVALGVVRNGHPVTLDVVPRQGQTQSDGTEVLAPPGTTGSNGMIGITLEQVRAPVGALGAVGSSFSTVWAVTSGTVAGLGHVVSPSGIGSLYHQMTNAHAAQQASANGTRVESIVGAVRTATQAEQAGLLPLIEVLIALNLVLAVVNMLPMLPLDGGHVAIAAYEWIRTRRGKPYYQADAAKLLPLAYGFITVLLLLVAAAVFLDIAHPMANPFR